jgi:hypothetical protein
MQLISSDRKRTLFAPVAVADTGMEVVLKHWPAVGVVMDTPVGAAQAGAGTVALTVRDRQALAWPVSTTQPCASYERS